MKQQDNIDILLKIQLENTSFNWDKNAAWSRLEKKRNRKLMQRSLIVAGLSVIILLAVFLKLNYKPAVEINLADEFEKRQKLEEYEQKMSGTYEVLLYCYDCNLEVVETRIKRLTESPAILTDY